MITYAIEEGIARLAMDDGKANALNPAMLRSLAEALDRAEEEEARLVILSGRPGIFSAGLDLKLMPTLSMEEKREVLDLFGRTVSRLFMLPIPSVAAVTGHAIAGGAILAYACDRRVILRGPYRLQLNEIANGMTLPRWMLEVARARVPAGRLAELTLHARPLGPDRALEMGVVQGIASDTPALFKRAEEISADLLALDRRCYGITKNRLFGPAIEDALERLSSERSGTFR